MNISMQLVVVVAAACLCLADGAPDGRLVRTKQQRPTRGFKNVEMMTARGFGKRDRPHTRAERDVDHQSSSSERGSRSTPTFKSPTVNIARDFGKRSSEGNEESYIYEASARRKFNPKNSLMVANDFGKRSGNEENYNEVLDTDDFLEILGSAPEKETQDNVDDRTVESIPVELFVMEMLNHPEFTRSVVSKFIDINQDGMLSLEELLRNTA